MLLLIETEQKLRGVEVAKQNEGVNIKPSVCPSVCSTFYKLLRAEILTDTR